MILCPISGVLGKDYWVSQWFSGNKKKYARYGMIGHNGVDIAIPIGTPLYAPLDGQISYADEGRTGYGKYVKITSDKMGPINRMRKIELGHLSRYVAGLDGKYVKMGEIVGMSGNTGDSTGPHVHITYKNLDPNGLTLDYNNGYKGAIDVSQWILSFDISKVLKGV